MTDVTPRFSQLLRASIHARGLGLDRVRDRLRQRGVSVSSASLSYWQSGRSLPERTSSLQAIPHLEEVLELEPGTLLRTLPATRDRPRRTAVRGLDALWPEPAAARVMARLDTRWDADLDRITLHDIVRIGPDRGQRSLTVRQAMRARADGPDRRFVLHHQNDANAPLPTLQAFRGCRVGHVERAPLDGVIAAELLFDRSLRRGETINIEYELHYAPPYPHEREYHRRLRLPMREFLLEVEFDPQARPGSTEAFRDERETSVEWDGSRLAHLMRTDVSPGVIGIRWQWPEPSPVNC